MIKRKRIAVLMTCFNRKEKTIKCLEALYKNKLLTSYSFEIYLVDDGCTDGTNQVVCEQFPDVHVIKGTGNLFWNGGMRLAWTSALECEFDYYIWLNDDSIIYSDALSRMIEAYNQLFVAGKKPGAVLGTMVEPKTKKPTYGGRNCNSRFNPLSFGDVLKPHNTSIECDFVNGNFTLIPDVSVKEIGILSESFTHGMGDYDYGLRLKKAGLTCWVGPGIYGDCETNSEVGSVKDKSISVKERAIKMNNISQLPPVNEWMHFVRLHGGFIWPLLWLKAWIRGRYPKLWVIIRGKNLG